MKKVEQNLESIIFPQIDKIIASEYGDKYLRYRQKWEAVERGEYLPDFPLHLDIDITGKCNLKCIMCPRQTNPNFRLGKGISEKLIERIIDESSEEGCCSLLMGTYSEPLLEKNKFLTIAEYAFSKGFCDIWFTTNGVFLSDDVSRDIIKMKITRIKLSLDAATRKTYQKVRGVDKFDQIIENIESFLYLRKKSGAKLPILRLSFVELKENKHEKEMFLEMWKNKADVISFQLFQDTSFELSNLTSEEIKIIKEDRTYCPHPFGRLAILYDGTARVCCNMITVNSKRFNLGNVKNNSIKQLWNSPRMKMIRKKIQNGKFYEIEECLQCKAAIYNSFLKKKPLKDNLL